MPKPVLHKQDFVRRYQAGEFGNRSPTWDSISSWRDKAQDGKLYHIRNRVKGGDTWYNLDRKAVEQIWFRLISSCGISPSLLYISEMAPTEKTLFQGEVANGIWGYDLTCTTVAKPMREALAEQTITTSGLWASYLLKYYLDTNSYDWLRHLLHSYPDHVVEFSTYSVQWGTVAGYNTVFWEVRNY